MSWDAEFDAYCANGDGRPAVDSLTVDVIDIAVDEDGFCWKTLALCADCMAAAS